MGLGGEQQADEDSGNEDQARSHVTLPALGGVGARLERREAAGGAISIVRSGYACSTAPAI